MKLHQLMGEATEFSKHRSLFYATQILDGLTTRNNEIERLIPKILPKNRTAIAYFVGKYMTQIGKQSYPESFQVLAVTLNKNNIRLINNPTEQVQLIAVKKNFHLIHAIMTPTAAALRLAQSESDAAIKRNEQRDIRYAKERGL